MSAGAASVLQPNSNSHNISHVTQQRSKKLKTFEEHKKGSSNSLKSVLFSKSDVDDILERVSGSLKEVDLTLSSMRTSAVRAFLGQLSQAMKDVNVRATHFRLTHSGVDSSCVEGLIQILQTARQSLVCLDLSNNKLRDNDVRKIFTELREFPELTHVSFRHNDKLRHAPLREIAACPSTLHTVDVSGCLVSNVPPAYLDNIIQCTGAGHGLSISTVAPVVVCGCSPTARRLVIDNLVAIKIAPLLLPKDPTTWGPGDIRAWAKPLGDDVADLLVDHNTTGADLIDPDGFMLDYVRGMMSHVACDKLDAHVAQLREQVADAQSHNAARKVSSASDGVSITNVVCERSKSVRMIASELELAAVQSDVLPVLASVMVLAVSVPYHTDTDSKDNTPTVDKSLLVSRTLMWLSALSARLRPGMKQPLFLVLTNIEAALQQGGAFGDVSLSSLLESLRSELVPFVHPRGPFVLHSRSGPLNSNANAEELERGIICLNVNSPGLARDVHHAIIDAMWREVEHTAISKAVDNASKVVQNLCELSKTPHATEPSNLVRLWGSLHSSVRLSAPYLQAMGLVWHHPENELAVLAPLHWLQFVCNVLRSEEVQRPRRRAGLLPCMLNRDCLPLPGVFGIRTQHDTSSAGRSRVMALLTQMGVAQEVHPTNGVDDVQWIVFPLLPEFDATVLKQHWAVTRTERGDAPALGRRMTTNIQCMGVNLLPQHFLSRLQYRLLESGGMELGLQNPTIHLDAGQLLVAGTLANRGHHLIQVLAHGNGQIDVLAQGNLRQRLLDVVYAHVMDVLDDYPNVAVDHKALCLPETSRLHVQSERNVETSWRLRVAGSPEALFIARDDEAYTAAKCTRHGRHRTQWLFGKLSNGSCPQPPNAPTFLDFVNEQVSTANPTLDKKTKKKKKKNTNSSSSSNHNSSGSSDEISALASAFVGDFDWLQRQHTKRYPGLIAFLRANAGEVAWTAGLNTNSVCSHLEDRVHKLQVALSSNAPALSASPPLYPSATYLRATSTRVSFWRHLFRLQDDPILAGILQSLPHGYSQPLLVPVFVNDSLGVTVVCERAGHEHYAENSNVVLLTARQAVVAAPYLHAVMAIMPYPPKAPAGVIRALCDASTTPFKIEPAHAQALASFCIGPWEPWSALRSLLQEYKQLTRPIDDRTRCGWVAVAMAMRELSLSIWKESNSVLAQPTMHPHKLPSGRIAWLCPFHKLEQRLVCPPPLCDYSLAFVPGAPSAAKIANLGRVPLRRRPGSVPCSVLKVAAGSKYSLVVALSSQPRAVTLEPPEGAMQDFACKAKLSTSELSCSGQRYTAVFTIEVQHRTTSIHVDDNVPSDDDDDDEKMSSVPKSERVLPLHIRVSIGPSSSPYCWSIPCALELVKRGSAGLALPSSFLPV